jgi:hypothetical protein
VPPMTLSSRLSILSAAAAVSIFTACRPKASPAECEELLDRYATLVVSSQGADASAADIEVERQREKREARGDDAFKNCSSEVSRAEFECAMHATSTDALEKCIE